MRPDNRKRGGFNWSSLIGWIIFILVIAGAPLLNLLGRVLGSASLPVNINSLLPILIGGLVVLSIVVSAVRALGGRSRAGGPRLPTDPGSPSQPPNASMPPFGNQRGLLRPPGIPTPRTFTQPTSRTTQQRPPTARFDPIINPVILVVGILGLLALGGAMLFFFAQGGP